MKPDLETLKTEVEEYLKTQELAVFRGFPRLADPASMVHWDSDDYPDFKAFLEIPKKLGVPLVVFHHRKLAADFIDDALDQLEILDLPDDEYVEMERRLREMRVFEGFTCAIELSFEHQSRVYFYTRRAEWYDELLDISEEIRDFTELENEDLEALDDLEDDMGPYFSKN
jgi:hypothetical protein